MSRITYKTALEWIIKNDDMKWIKEEKPVAPALVKFVSEIYRVEVPKIVRTLRKDMGLDKTEEAAPKVKAPKAVKAKAEKPAKAGKPVKAAAKAPATKAPAKPKKTKADRQAALKVAPLEAAAPIAKTPVTGGESSNAVEA